MDIGGELIGRIGFKLDANVIPKTVEKLRQLCLGEAGMGTKSCIPREFLFTELSAISYAKEVILPTAMALAMAENLYMGTIWR
jgi:cyclophilin family peptidyl-prolyl cis-trans isomerase